jgi:hypothetical protein
LIYFLIYGSCIVSIDFLDLTYILTDFRNATHISRDYSITTRSFAIKFHRCCHPCISINMNNSCDARHNSSMWGANLIQYNVNGHKIQTQRIVWFLFCTCIPSTYSHNKHARPMAICLRSRCRSADKTRDVAN